MLSNSGVNINDSIQVKNHLNIYYNAQFSYFAYQQVISNCATFAGSYVLPRKGTEADFVESAYRFGFNGQEKDNDTYGEGNAYDFGDRIQDPRLGGRFLSIDPDAVKYPFMSPYCYAANSPIRFIDKNGRGPIDPRTWTRESTFLMLADEVIIFAIYPKTNVSTSYDATMDFAGNIKSWLGEGGYIGARMSEMINLGTNRNHKIKGGFVDRLGSINNQAESNNQVAPSIVYKDAANSGNYDYKDNNLDGSFSIVSVKDGIISQTNDYKKNNSTNEYELIKTTSLKVSYTEEIVEACFEGSTKYQVVKTFANVTETIKDMKSGKTETKTYKHETSTEKRTMDNQTSN